MLLKKQRNILFSILQTRGINSADFDENREEESYELSITPNDDEYFFYLELGNSLMGNAHPYEIKMRPGLNATISEVTTSTFEKVVDYFDTWATNLKEELEAPDLWAEAAKTAQLFASPAAPNEKFTDHELRELQSQLRAVEQKLTASGLPEAAIKELTAALRDATPKAEGMTKKDWQNMVIGAVVGTLTNLALSAEHVTTVYLILKTTFTGWLLH